MSIIYVIYACMYMCWEDHLVQFICFHHAFVTWPLITKFSGQTVITDEQKKMDKVNLVLVGSNAVQRAVSPGNPETYNFIFVF